MQVATYSGYGAPMTFGPQSTCMYLLDGTVRCWPVDMSQEVRGLWTYSGYSGRINMTDALLWDETMKTERPTAVPPTWALYGRVLGPFATQDEAAAAGLEVSDEIVAQAQAGAEVYPHGWIDVQHDDGSWGEIIYYWAPADEPYPYKKSESSKAPLFIALVVGVIGLIGVMVYAGGAK